MGKLGRQIVGHADSIGGLQTEYRRLWWLDSSAGSSEMLCCQCVSRSTACNVAGAIKAA
ncbi:Unknown protein sequence [Pseudomonas coronafaciens pv. oryzae]|nr:Unknown protein sequence [Pseudomonas coronafaciens pv. oryzae]